MGHAQKKYPNSAYGSAEKKYDSFCFKYIFYGWLSIRATEKYTMQTLYEIYKK